MQRTMDIRLPRQENAAFLITGLLLLMLVVVGFTRVLERERELIIVNKELLELQKEIEKNHRLIRREQANIELVQKQIHALRNPQ